MIADDHPLFAEGLKNLTESRDLSVIGIVNDVEKAVETALIEKPEVIFMDIDMPIINGIEAIKKIKNELPEARIIMLTSFEEEDSLLKAVKAGASGYLLKSLDGEELIRSLLDIQNGKNPFSPGLGDYLLNEIQRSLSSKEEKNSEKEMSIENIEDEELLTDRQIDVIKMLVSGLTYKEIGEELFLSERTIKYHIEQIKKRLNFKTQAQIITYARNKFFS